MVMKYIVILDDSSSNFWVIVDQFYDSCPESPVYYTNTVNHPKVDIIEECGKIMAIHAATGANSTATSIKI